MQRQASGDDMFLPSVVPQLLRQESEKSSPRSPQTNLATLRYTKLLRQVSIAKKNGALREGELESLKTRILNQESITPDEEDFLLDQVQASVERRTLFKRVEKLGIKDSLQGGDEEEEKEQESKQEEGSKPMLIVLRGISGSGKSTLSKSLVEDGGVVHSTDDFFVDPATGAYQFNATLLGRAHEWNQQRTRVAMAQGVSPIVIDNTNTQKWEAKPYVELALQHDYAVSFAETSTDWRFDAEELARRNKHGVPLVAIKRMIQRWETDFTVENVLASKPPSRARRKPPRAKPPR